MPQIEKFNLIFERKRGELVARREELHQIINPYAQIITERAMSVVKYKVWVHLMVKKSKFYRFVVEITNHVANDDGESSYIISYLHGTATAK